MQDLKISVSICTRNRCGRLEQALASLAGGEASGFAPCTACLVEARRPRPYAFRGLIKNTMNKPFSAATETAIEARA